MLNRGNTGSTVWADTAYRSKKNEEWLEKNGYVCDIHQKKPKGRPMSEATSRANGRRSKIRAFVGHVFAQQKSRMSLFVRTIGIARGQDQDRDGQPRLQSHPLRKAPRANCTRMTAKAAQTAAAMPKSANRINLKQPKSEAIAVHQSTQNIGAVLPVRETTVVRGIQLELSP